MQLFCYNYRLDWDEFKVGHMKWEIASEQATHQLLTHQHLASEEKFNID